VPSFVEREFRQFVGCGVWARGFARFRCDDCHAERLVPFSCKARAVCPSCGGRRMAERAAHLVDHVLPAVPIRQWVLSLPFQLRYVLAWNHRLCRRVLGVHVRALRGFYRRRARRQGVVNGETGAVTAIQRFGSGLNLNVHMHTLTLDGVFSPDAEGGLRFVPAAPPTAREIAPAGRGDRDARGPPAATSRYPPRRRREPTRRLRRKTPRRSPPSPPPR